MDPEPIHIKAYRFVSPPRTPWYRTFPGALALCTAVLILSSCALSVIWKHFPRMEWW